MPSVPVTPTRALRSALAGALLLLAGCRATAERSEPEFMRAIRARSRHLEEQFRAGNMLGVADVYADDAVLVDGRGERTVGRAEIDAYWSAIEDPVDWTLEVHRIRGTDAVAYELGTSRLALRRGGELMVSETDFLIVWRRDDTGAWRIELDAYWPAEER